MRIPMSTLQSLALRNIRRNRRRSGITMFTICCGCVALVIFSGYVDYSLWGLRESTIRTRLGHLQIVTGKSPEISRRLLEERERVLINSLLAGDQSVALFTPRLSLAGLIGNGDQTCIFTGEGVIPEREELISSYFMETVSGRLLRDDDEDAVAITAGLAEKLNVSVNDHVSLFVTTVDGGFNAMDLNIAGIFSTGSKDLDDRFLFVPLRAAQSLLYTENVSTIVVLLKDTGFTEEAAGRLQSALAEKQIDVDVVQWTELADFYFKVQNTYEGISRFVWVVLGIIVLLSIANTMVMSVIERTREIGTISALGAGPSDIVRLFVFEGLLIGVIGGILGILCGSAIALAINHWGGIHIAPPPGSSRQYYVLITLQPATLVCIAAYAVAVSVVASLYPAHRAASLKTVEALRHV